MAHGDLVGQILGSYELVGFIGMEGAAEVYTCYHPEAGMQVLARLVGRDMPPDPVWSSRFRREAKLIAELHHANIAPAYDFGEALDGHYMVSEYSEGTSLADLLARIHAGERQMSQDDISFLVRQIAAALDHAHTRGVVHRDVNPARIQLSKSGQAVLADFGLALLLSRGSPEDTAGSEFGVAAYMAPEAAIDFRAASPASDLYSLGAILFEIVTGELPILADHAPDPRLLNPALPPTVADVIQTALAPASKDRFKSAMLMATTLEWAYAHPNGASRTQVKNGRVAASVAAATGASVKDVAERVVVKRGPSVQDERREKARLRAEHRRIQQEERRLAAQEKKRIEQEKQRIARAKMWQTLRRWRPTILAIVAVVLLIGGVSYGLQAAGILSISLGAPALSAGGTKSTESSLTATGEQTQAPVGQPQTAPAVEATATPTELPVEASTPIPTVQATPLKTGDSAFRLQDGGQMMFIPAGQFLMGTDDFQRLPMVRPQHPVMLSDYWIDRTEVTNVQYALCMASGTCQPPGQTIFLDNPDYADYPVTFVTYEKAAIFCLWLAGSSGQVIGLPTEAQWEKAAAWDPVNLEARKYPWGNTEPNSELMRYNVGPDFRPASPVGSHPAGQSAYGVQDMAGNVWEWTADWFDPEYYQRTGIATDPAGPGTGAYRVTRGGSWRHEPNLALSTVRNPALPTESGDSLGFRCAMTAGLVPPESGVLLTPLDVTHGLADVVSAATSDEANDSNVLVGWLTALDDLKQALQVGDQGGALALIAELSSRVDEQAASGQITAGLSWRLASGLDWIRGRLTVVTQPVQVPTELVTETEALTPTEVESPTSSP